MLQDWSTYATTRLLAPRNRANVLLLAAFVFGVFGLATAAVMARRPAVAEPLPARIIIMPTRAPVAGSKLIEPQSAPTVAPSPIPATPEPVAAPPTAAPEIIYGVQAAPPTAAPVEEPPVETWHPPLVLPLSDEQAREWANMPEGWHPPMALPPAVQCVQTRGGGMCVEEQP